MGHALRYYFMHRDNFKKMLHQRNLSTGIFLFGLYLLDIHYFGEIFYEIVVDCGNRSEGIL